ncbi:Heat shock protein 90-4 [Glycine soja]
MEIFLIRDQIEKSQELHHYASLEDLIHQAIKVEQQVKRKQTYKKERGSPFKSHEKREERVMMVFHFFNCAILTLGPHAVFYSATPLSEYDTLRTSIKAAVVYLAKTLVKVSESDSFYPYQALDKIRFESLTEKIKLDGQPELFIHIISDKTNNTLSIIDNGIGMTKAGKSKTKLAELLRYHSTKSGDDMTSPKDYVTRMKEGHNDI